MSTKVGSLYYEVSVDTSKMIEGQKQAEKSSEVLSTTLTSTAAAARTHAVATGVAATAMREAAKAADAEAAATSKLGVATDKATLSAKQLTAATRNLPAQFTDIAVSLQAGQSPLTVFLQQGGQLKDMFGGAGAAAKAMGTYVLGLINPFTVAAAAVGTFLYGLVKGQEEMTSFQRSATHTGGTAEVTADQLNAMAVSLDGLANVTRGQAAEALNTFVTEGVRGRDSIERFTAAAIRLEQTGGPAVEKTAQAFASLGKDPLQASLKLNESVGFLTESLYQQIKSLEDQGKHTEAARVAQNAYADAINSRTPQILENLGWVEKSLNAIGAGFRELGNLVLSVGRDSPIAEQLEKARAKLDKMQGQRPGWAFGMTQKAREEAIAAQRDIVYGLEEQLRLGARLATQQGEQADKVREQAEWDRLKEKHLDKTLRMEREIAQVRQAGARSGKSPKEIADEVAKIEKAYADKSPKAPRARKAAEPFDEAGYLAGLERRAVDVWSQIDVIEKEALRQAEENRGKNGLSAEGHERAKTLIMQAAAMKRAEIQEGLDNLIRERTEKSNEKELAEQAKMEKRRNDARKAINGTNPVDEVIFDAEQQIAKQEAAKQLDLENTQLYEDAKVAIYQQAANKIAQIQQEQRDKEAAAMSAQLQNYGQLFGGIASITKAFAGEQSGAYKAMFAVSKAFAIADATMKLGQAVMNANFSAPWPANFAAMASVAAAGGTVLSSIKGASFGGGRQYGGPVSAGTMYRVNETGRPEMFTAANGSQYMLPTAGGNVTPANQVGAGGMPTITVVFNTSTQLQEQSRSWNEQTQTVEIAVSEVASQISNNSGRVWSALRSATNVQSKL